jgi:hypothetical protein
MVLPPLIGKLGMVEMIFTNLAMNMSFSAKRRFSAAFFTRDVVLDKRYWDASTRPA